MYCSSCGGAVAQNSSYCNLCGVKLSNAKAPDVAPAAVMPAENLVWAIVAVFIVGLGCIIGLMAVMKDLLNLNNNFILAVIFLSFLLMLAIEGVFIRLLLNHTSKTKETSDDGQLKAPATRELDAAPACALAEPLPSVTEHTTRTLEPIYRERKAE